MKQVEQGWIAAENHTEFSEAVIVHFDPKLIPLKVLIEVHLRTHSATANHSMRSKYRSAIYTFDDAQFQKSKEVLDQQQQFFDEVLITSVLQFQDFKINDERYLNYYQKNPDKPFCKNVIDPKLKILLRSFSEFTAIDLTIANS